MSKTGADFITSALREIQVIDPTAVADGDELSDGLLAAADLLDSWRTDKLLVRGVTRSTYPLVSGTQTYTIGTGGTLNQDYPTAIERWGVIPARAAANPIELPMGRPVTFEEWRLVRVKSTAGNYPTLLYYDNRYAAGLGNILVYPVPNTTTADLVLYSAIPQITALVAATTYNLPPGYQRALTLGLALELSDRYGKGAVVTPRLEARAAKALGDVKRMNIIPHPRRMQSRFIIGSRAGWRTHNIYSDG